MDPYYLFTTAISLASIYGEIRGAHDWGRQFPEVLSASALERLVLPENRPQLHPTAKLTLQLLQDVGREQSFLADVARGGNEDAEGESSHRFLSHGGEGWHDLD